MDRQLVEQIERDFSEPDQQQIIDLLKSLEGWPHLAGADERLKRLQLAVLQLAGGNIARLIHYLNYARQDEALVIAWAKLDPGT